MAVISFDFSAQATCPSDRPYSLAQTLTEMQRPQPLLAIVTPPQRLAVHRQDRSLHAGLRGRLGAQRLQPVGEAGLEGGRLEHHQDAAEDVLARDPVGQVEHLHEELFLQGRPAGDPFDGHAIAIGPPDTAIVVHRKHVLAPRRSERFLGKRSP